MVTLALILLAALAGLAVWVALDPTPPAPRRRR